MKSLNVVFTGPRQAELRTEEVPGPPAGEVTLQTLVSLLSTGTESSCYRGEFDGDSNWASWVKYPFYPGYCNVARVIKVGEGVDDLKEGDRIFSNTSHRQFANIAADREDVIRLPDCAGDDDAAWSALSYISQTAVRRGEHAMGDTAVVIGLGPLGQLVTQYLRVIGLREILAVDTAGGRLDSALTGGATEAFCGSAADAGEFVKEHTDRRLADVVYDVTGHYAVLPLALKLVRNFGTLVLLGDSPHPSKQHLTCDVLTRQIRIVGTHNYSLPPEHSYWTVQREVLLFLQYVRRGQMNVADLITHRFKPAEAPEVYEKLQEDRGSSIGVLFDWQ